jgi:hypothetical protein
MLSELAMVSLGLWNTFQASETGQQHCPAGILEHHLPLVLQSVRKGQERTEKVDVVLGSSDGVLQPAMGWQRCDWI